MYRVEGKERSVRQLDGTYRIEKLPAVEFRTAAGLLRWALNARVLAHGIGGLPYPSRFDDKWLGGRDGDVGYDYHLVDTFSKYKITSEHLTTMRRAQRRYAEIVHYLREVEPEWAAVMEHHYADNSVVRTDANKYGQTRRVTLKHPSGDACF